MLNEVPFRQQKYVTTSGLVEIVSMWFERRIENRMDEMTKMNRALVIMQIVYEFKI